jgi:hypothetical protein
MRFLDLIPPANVSMLFAAWSSSLLTNPKFATDFPLHDCTIQCRSVILPGGLDSTRKVEPFLNQAIYSGAMFPGSDTIRIDTATGMILKFEVPAGSDVYFDIWDECVYAGGQINNGLQICFRQDENSMVVGKTLCSDQSAAVLLLGEELITSHRVVGLSKAPC